MATNRAIPDPKVSEFVSIEDGPNGPNVTVWHANGDFRVLLECGSRVRAEEITNTIRNALATWPHWQR